MQLKYSICNKYFSCAQCLQCKNASRLLGVKQINCMNLKIEYNINKTTKLWKFPKLFCFSKFPKFPNFLKVSESFQKFLKVSESFRLFPEISLSFKSLETHCHGD